MKLDREISHPCHPHHRLQLEYTETPFRCDGCREAGIGLKYSCRSCEFDLHRVCALASPTATHPFYRSCEFRFCAAPPGSAERMCDACGGDTLGFVYHCGRCGFDLHPCCASLPQVLDDGERSLRLRDKLSSPCLGCGRRGKGWCYRSDGEGCALHVSCVKEMMVESWQAMSLSAGEGRPRELQTKIPSLGRSLEERRRKGKLQRCCQIAGGAIRIVVSAILGDPTAVIAAVIGGLISK